MDRAPFISRQEHFALVDSTNDVVRRWLAEGTPEVCVAWADEQAAGRGRDGRSWQAPSGAALLVSLGFRPDWLRPEHVWRLAAAVSVSMTGAAEEAAGLAGGTIRLKWPNDLVVEDGGPADPRAGTVRKLAGVLGETDGLGAGDPQATIGIGINVDWAPGAFPADLATGMTSLREASGRQVDRTLLLDAFIARLETAVVALRAGRFALDDWHDRQLTTGRDVRLEQPDGSAEVVRAIGVDRESGALVVEDAAAAGGRRSVLSGEIRHARLGGRAPSPAGV